MNNIKKIFLAILGGADVVIYIIMPIMIVILWSLIVGLEDWSSILLYFIGGLSSLYRGIKIGLLKND